MGRNSSTERQPLLGDHDARRHEREGVVAPASGHEPTNANAASVHSSSPPLQPPKPAAVAAGAHGCATTKEGLPRAQFLRAVVVGLLIFFIGDTGILAGDLATNAFYESALCYQRYPDLAGGSFADRLRDPRCKSEGVQGDLAVLKGWVNMWLVVPALVMAMPFGLVADKYGPQVVLMIIWVGDALLMLGHSIISYYPGTFDLRLLYPASLATIVGGGGIGYAAMTYVYASGMSTDENRSTIFLYVLAMQYLDAFVTGPVAYLAMNIGPVFSLGVCITCFAISFCLCPLLPTLPKQQSKKDAAKAAKAAAATSGTDEDDDNLTSKNLSKPWHSQIAGSTKEMFSAFAAIFQDSFYAGLLLFGLIFSTLGAAEQDLRVQYVAKKFHWTWAQAGLLNTVRSAVSLPMITIVLPAIAYLLQHRLRLAPLRKDLWVARGSVVVLVTGSVLQGLAPTAALFVASVAFYELSRGYTAALLSVIAGLVDPAHESMVYVCVSMMQAVGMLIAGPLLGEVFSLGFRLGESWYGLPFLLCAGLQAVSMLFAFVVRVRGGAAT